MGGTLKLPYQTNIVSITLSVVVIAKYNVKIYYACKFLLARLNRLLIAPPFSLPRAASPFCKRAGSQHQNKTAEPGKARQQTGIL